MRKLIAGGVLAATIAGGSVAVATVSPIGLAGAQSDPSTPTTSAEQPPPAEGERRRPGQVLDEALGELVADGTLTQQQADAVRDRLEAKAKEHRSEHGIGRGPGQRPFGLLKDALEPVAGTLGMTAEELASALRDGTTLNELAAQQGVDPGAVRQQVIDQATARIDQAVADGKLDAARAEEAKARLPEMVDRFMEEGARHPGGGGWRHHRGGAEGPPADAPSAEPAPQDDGG